MDESVLSATTRVVSLGRPAREPDAPLNVPPTLTSTYVAGGPRGYGRESNPTWDALEGTLGALEGGRALIFGSGMAAVTCAMSLLPQGGTLVAPTHAYMGTRAQVAQLEQRGYTVRVVPLDDTDALVAATEGADVVWLETMANPMLETPDLAAVAQAAKRHGAITVCDNTLATPLLVRPLEQGVDIVLHSATKYLSGHSDVLMGALVTADDALYERLWEERTLTGGIAGPFDAYLVLRGIRTLAVRLERASSNARTLAERLRGHAAVATVRDPGFGAMLAFDLDADPEAGAEHAEAVCEAVQLWVHSTSLGSVESQLERRRRYPEESPSVPASLIRLSVGIEDVDDLWNDLAQALDRGRSV